MIVVAHREAASDRVRCQSRVPFARRLRRAWPPMDQVDVLRRSSAASALPLRRCSRRRDAGRSGRRRATASLMTGDRCRQRHHFTAFAQFVEMVGVPLHHRDALGPVLRTVVDRAHLVARLMRKLSLDHVGGHRPLSFSTVDAIARKPCATCTIVVASLAQCKIKLVGGKRLAGLARRRDQVLAMAGDLAQFGQNVECLPRQRHAVRLRASWFSRRG